MEWVKDYVDSGDHPQMVQAGYWGREVFRTLCRLSGKYGLRGQMPAGYLDGNYLAGRIGLTTEISPDPAASCEEGVQACFESGLLMKASAGGATIDGWDRKQPSPTKAAEKIRLFRERRNHGVTQSYRKRRQEPEPDSEPESELEETTTTPGDAVVALWNETADPEMPRCEGLRTTARREAAKKLLAVVQFERWPKLIANANASDFCRGHGKQGWKLSLAGMLKQPELALKVLEGNYGTGDTGDEYVTTYPPGGGPLLQAVK